MSSDQTNLIVRYWGFSAFERADDGMALKGVIDASGLDQRLCLRLSLKSSDGTPFRQAGITG